MRKLDRLGHSLRVLITMLDDLKRPGVKFGQKPKLSPEQIDHAREQIGKDKRREDVAALLNVDRNTLYHFQDLIRQGLLIRRFEERL